MRKKKCALCALALLLLLAAGLRPAYAVSVDGRALPGLWSAGSVRRAVETARAAAEEVARGPSALPACALRLRLTLLPPAGDETALARALLGGAAGVESAWRVLLDGEPLGTVRDETALLEAVETNLAAGAAYDAAYVALDRALTLRPAYIPAGSETPLPQLMQALREATRVVSVTADGRVSFTG